ncbi:hypothetical protein [Dialister invisus]|uniref:hypothetical protein n=1 Tax=Dialister invisus TaxID=218538 RepID=UPI0026703BCE|nr:hypothetical protein [Dialister invisus]
MEKIDWKNLSYYDFIGFVAVTIILLFVLYFGGLWYATYDYRIQMRDQMVEMYRQLPNPIPPIKDDYGVHKRWLVYYITGTRTYNMVLDNTIMNEYGNELMSQGWEISERYTEHDKSGEFNSIVYSKGEFILGITVWKNQNKCRFSLIKEDWIYKKGF